MTRQTASRSPTLRRSILALLDVRRASWSMLSAPILHGISTGSSSFWDEIISFGMMGGIVVVLLALTFLGGRRRRKGKRRDK